MKRCCFLLGVIILSVAGCTDNGGSRSQDRPEEVYTPVVTYPFEPTAPFLGSDNKYHLIYGLKLTNASGLSAKIEKIEVLDANRKSVPIKTYQGKEILPLLFHLNSGKSDNLEIQSSSSRVLFVSLDFDSEEVIPQSLVHKISLDGAAGPGSKSATKLSYETVSFPVFMRMTPVISSPLKGDGWVVFNGCCSFEGAHQASMLPVNGTLYNTQRFAIDFMKLNEKNHLVEGDPSVPSHWVCYNEEVYAISNGKVVSVLDGLPDQDPGTLPDPSSLTMKTVTGNHVVLKLGENLFAFYAHLQNGSIKVKVGDRVFRGKEIARIGNSGNTSAPHLHLHLMASPSPIGSLPVPYVYDQFKVSGSIDPKDIYQSDKLTGTYGNRGKFTPKSHHNQLPMDLTIVEFGRDQEVKTVK